MIEIGYYKQSYHVDDERRSSCHFETSVYQTVLTKEKEHIYTYTLYQSISLQIVMHIYEKPSNP